MSPHLVVFALDAAGGPPMAAFGAGERVDMRAGLGRESRDSFPAATTPGAVYRDLKLRNQQVAGSNPAVGSIRMPFRIVRLRSAGATPQTSSDRASDSNLLAAGADGPGMILADIVLGARAGTILYRLVETAKVHELEPFATLHHVLAELPEANELEQIEALLPRRIDRGLLQDPRRNVSPE